MRASILIVEDSRTQAAKLQDVLERHGYRVSVAGDGQEALRQIAVAAPSVVVSDVLMPVMDGHELCRRIRADERTRELPVVLLTSLAGSDDVFDGLACGADYFISKPYTESYVVASLDKIVSATAEDRTAGTHDEEKITLPHAGRRITSSPRRMASLLLSAYEAAVDRNAEVLRCRDEIGALEAARKSLRDVLECSPEAMLVTDEAGIVLYANRVTATVLGATPKEMEGTLFGLALEDSKDHIEIELPRRQPESGVGEMRVVQASWNGAQARLVAIRDITDRVHAEAQKHALAERSREQQKLEAIGTLAGGVAHEINNPVMGIMNYAQLIREGLPADSRLAEFADGIAHETERVATVVRNLLQFARRDRGSLRVPTKVRGIADAALSLIQPVIRKDQILLNVDIPEDLPAAPCSSQQIEQVLINLLTNARDALNERYPAYDADKIIRITARVLGPGPEVNERARAEPAVSGIAADHRGETETLATRDGAATGATGPVGTPAAPKQQPPTSDCRPSSPGSWLRLTVEDHGAGIPDEIRERLFEPFFTTKSRAPAHGTGMGLAISQGIARDHGGELTFENRAGGGTLFHLDLPAVEPSA